MFCMVSFLGYQLLPFWEEQSLQEVVRYIMVTFFATSFYLLSRGLPVRWPTMTRRVKRVSLWFYLLLISGIWRAIEAAEQDAPIGPANFFVLFVTIGLTLALMWKPSNDDSTKPIYTKERIKAWLAGR